MNDLEIIKGKYMPVLEYLNDQRGKYYPKYKQKYIAEMTGCSVRSVRDYISGKKTSWVFLFKYADLLLCNLNFTVDSMIKSRN